VCLLKMCVMWLILNSNSVCAKEAATFVHVFPIKVTCSKGMQVVLYSNSY
jgi:hypothetical protein